MGSAIRTAEEDKKQVLAHQMHQLFIEADEQGNGVITCSDFESHLMDPQLLGYLKVIDVQPEEAWHLFNILDTEGIGEIDAEELVNGCLRLQGGAKAIELAAFMHEYRQTSDRIEKSLAFLAD